jgi:hypothetical protein
MMRRIENMPGVNGIIIGRSYGGKSLGNGSRTGTIKIQREMPGGIKAVTQTEKGLQEIFILTDPDAVVALTNAILKLNG